VGLQDMENSKDIEQFGRNNQLTKSPPDMQRSLSEDL
jgi:hypothetical protein